MKVASVVGARPQFIKAAMVSREIRQRTGISELIIHTGQHYDDGMSKVFFEELAIPAPEYNLGIGSGPHGAQTGRMLEAVEQVFLAERPDWVIVYGDTNSTLAGALAAAKLKIPVAHVEAGLRSFNRAMPEEVNRVVADHVADLLFAPSAVAVDHLRREGIDDKRIHHVGDVMYDATLFFAERAERTSRIVDALGLEPGRYVLGTIHRAENTDNGAKLAAIFLALSDLARTIPVVVPLHPRTRQALERLDLLRELSPGLQIVAPVGYLEMASLERHARLIVTDSGGVQKEAFFHGVPCVTLREETEWPETVALGWNRLVPPQSRTWVLEGIVEAMRQGRGRPGRPYGDGHASRRIADILEHAAGK